jgi:hypothetical protein
MLAASSSAVRGMLSRASLFAGGAGLPTAGIRAYHENVVDHYGERRVHK